MVEVSSLNVEDAVRFFEGEGSTTIVQMVAYGQAHGGDSLAPGDMGWLTIQHKIRAGDRLTSRYAQNIRREGLAQFQHITKLHIKYRRER